MVEVPSKRAIVIYAKLWKIYKNKIFSNEDVNKIIQINSNNLSQKKRKASINYQDVVSRSINPLKGTKQVKLFDEEVED